MKNILIFVMLLAFCSCSKEKELAKINEPISDTVQCVIESIKSNPELWENYNYFRTEFVSDSFKIGIIFTDTTHFSYGEIPIPGFINFYDIDCTVKINSTEEKLIAETIAKYISEPMEVKRLREESIADSLKRIQLHNKLNVLCNK